MSGGLLRITTARSLRRGHPFTGNYARKAACKNFRNWQLKYKRRADQCCKHRRYRSRGYIRGRCCRKYHHDPILMEIDPAYMIEEPYVPVVRRYLTSAARRVGLDVQKMQVSLFFPAVSDYIGGDIALTSLHQEWQKTMISHF